MRSRSVPPRPFCQGSRWLTSPIVMYFPRQMGADHFISTAVQGWNEPLRYELDLIVSTSNCDKDFPLKEYLSLLTVHGKFVNVGLPEVPLPELRVQDFIPQGASLTATHIGNKVEAVQMLQIAAEKGLKSWIQLVKLSEDGCKQVIEGVKNSQARYRYVLTDFDAAF
jgi:alcohol dehydrogenase (NADP+)